MTAMLTFSGDPALLPGGLRTRLQRWLANRYGQAQSWHIDLIRSAGKRGRNRRILRARNAQGYAIAVKSHDSRLRNRREYHALRKLHDTMSDSIAPIYLAHDCKYYAMEWVDGPLLSRSLGQSDHAVRIAQTGQWLARLHAHATPRRLCETRLPDLQLPWRRGSGEIAVATTRLKQRLRTLEPGRQGRARSCMGISMPETSLYCPIGSWCSTGRKMVLA